MAHTKGMCGPAPSRTWFKATCGADARGISYRHLLECERRDYDGYASLTPTKVEGHATLMMPSDGRIDVKQWRKESRKIAARKAEALGLKNPGCKPRAEPAPEVVGDTIVPRLVHVRNRAVMTNKSGNPVTHGCRAPGEVAKTYTGLKRNW